MISLEIFNNIIENINKKNQQDPKIHLSGIPEELFYSQKMSETLKQFYPQANQQLQIACHGQHIQRWQYPRTDYPEGRNGYLKWRQNLYKIHSSLIVDILVETGVNDNNFIETVSLIIAKKKIKTNADSQRLEDVACLVFLQYYFDDFIKKTKDEQKIINIVQKTWQKMSEEAHQFALKATFSKQAQQLIEKTLN